MSVAREVPGDPLLLKALGLHRDSPPTDQHLGLPVIHLVITLVAELQRTRHQMPSPLPGTETLRGMLSDQVPP